MMTETVQMNFQILIRLSSFALIGVLAFTVSGSAQMTERERVLSQMTEAQKLQIGIGTPTVGALLHAEHQIIGVAQDQIFLAYRRGGLQSATWVCTAQKPFRELVFDAGIEKIGSQCKAIR